ncbi:MAG TPA: hypothetical protein ENN99_09060 [Chloroflexi bacterium]|nr:hypothetical protein [Chloroflexota bacterium]
MSRSSRTETSGAPTDLRARRRQEQRRLFWMVVGFLVGGGGIAIALLYGPRAAVLGVACLLAGAGVLGLLWFIMHLFEQWAG